jgi:hypothetical protein
MRTIQEINIGLIKDLDIMERKGKVVYVVLIFLIGFWCL